MFYIIPKIIAESPMQVNPKLLHLIRTQEPSYFHLR